MLLICSYSLCPSGQASKVLSLIPFAPADFHHGLRPALFVPIANHVLAVLHHDGLSQFPVAFKPAWIANLCQNQETNMVVVETGITRVQH